MKIFIVFMGLLVINVSFLSYQEDMEKFMIRQAFLKFTAEECAASAATLLEEEAYAKGWIVFKYEEGQLAVDEHINYVKNHSKINGTMVCDLIFEDDQAGYGLENPNRMPAVTAIVKVEMEDMFKLPMLTLTKIERKARYELDRSS